MVVIKTRPGRRARRRCAGLELIRSEWRGVALGRTWGVYCVSNKFRIIPASELL